MWPVQVCWFPLRTSLLETKPIGTAQLQMAIGFIGIFQGMLVDTILLVRLITVHPLSRIGLARFILLTSLPITVKVTRVVNVFIYIDHLSTMARGPTAFQRIDSAWITLPYMKIEWIAQMVDNRSVHYTRHAVWF